MVNKMEKKNAYILGGSGLIGKEIVSQFSKKNYQVICLDIKFNFHDKTNQNVINCKFDSTDLSNEEIKKLGIPDIFVDASFPAAKNWSMCNFDNLKKKYVLEGLQNNLANSILITRFFAESMKNNKKKMRGGSIVNISSIYGLVAQDLSLYKGIKNMRENAIYPVIKAGLIAYARQMASYYSKYNIRINTITPGGVLGHNKNTGRKQSKKFLKNYENRVPLKRLADAKEIASAVNYLCSRESSYITGINLVIDGGWTAI